MSEVGARQLLGAGRFRWPQQPQIAVGKDAERTLRKFMAERAR
jgi:hypothetical protein